jgi:hypothetical protein
VSPLSPTVYVHSSDPRPGRLHCSSPNPILILGGSTSIARPPQGTGRGVAFGVLCARQLAGYDTSSSAVMESVAVRQLAVAALGLSSDAMRADVFGVGYGGAARGEDAVQ